jgi:hypothetical protein
VKYQVWMIQTDDGRSGMYALPPAFKTANDAVRHLVKHWNVPIPNGTDVFRLGSMTLTYNPHWGIDFPEMVVIWSNLD